MDRATVRIAIVDDEESIRKALTRLFRFADYGAEAFESAADFLASLSERPADCVVLDLQMQGMTGLELLEHLSRLPTPPPVIVVTADDTQRTQDECKALGTRYYLRKPVDCATLLASVRDVLVTDAG